MSDILLPAPASISSQEVDCKWVRRPFGGSVIHLDIARDTVSIDINVKSTRGHTSIHLTPWDSTPQYKKWNDTYRPHEKISQQIGAFRAAERKARSSIHSRHISLNWTAKRGITHPFHHHLDHRYPAGTLDLYHHEENSMVPQGLEGHERPEEVTGAQDLEPIRIKERAPTPACSTPPPTLHEETPEIVGRPPT